MERSAGFRLRPGKTYLFDTFSLSHEAFAQNMLPRADPSQGQSQELRTAGTGAEKRHLTPFRSQEKMIGAPHA